MKAMMLILCAWVLWSSTFTRAGGSPDVRGGEIAPAAGYDTRGDCLAAMKAFLAVPEGAKDQGVIGTTVWRDIGDGRAATAYQCLPDTIDPRGPKGGR